MGPGLYEPLFQFTPYISEGIGIPANYKDTVSVIDNRVVMLCSDNHLRSYSGETLELPLDLNRCEKILREIEGNAVAVYSPEGYYAIWWSDALDSNEFTTGLRFDLIPGGGIAASFIDLDDTIYMKPCAISRALQLQMSDGTSLSQTGILCYMYNPTVVAQYSEVGDYGWNVYTQSYVQGGNADLPWSVTFGQYKGEYDGYILTHTESVLTTQGAFSTGTFELLTDGAANESFGQRIAHSESITLSGALINASIALTRNIVNLRYVQIRLSGTESSGFELCRVQSSMVAADRPYRNGSPVLNFGDDTSRLCYQNAMSGYRSQVLQGDATNMDTRLSTFQPDAPIICTDGVRRVIETLKTVAGDCAVVKLANQEAPASDSTGYRICFAGFWLRTNNFMAPTWQTIGSFGNVYTLQIKSRYDAPTNYWDIRIYTPLGVLATQSIVAPVGTYAHIHFVVTAYSTVALDSLGVAVNAVPVSFYSDFKTTVQEDFVIGGGFCTKDSNGGCQPRVTVPTEVHDLRCGLESQVVVPNFYYNDYMSNQGAFVTPATNIYP